MLFIMVLFCACKKESDPLSQERKFNLSLYGVNQKLFVNGSDMNYTGGLSANCKTGDVIRVVCDTFSYGNSHKLSTVDLSIMDGYNHRLNYYGGTFDRNQDITITVK